MLLHAGVGDRRLWDGQVEDFARGRLVVRPDLRGFGETPLPGRPFSHVEDVRALLDHLGIERTDLVGNSFGGRVALDLALAHPDRIGALVLVASALTGWEFSEEMEAFDAEEDALLDGGKLDEAVELNVRTWLDGRGRGPAPVPAATRERLAEMQRLAFETIVSAYERSPEPGPTDWPEPEASTRLHDARARTLVVIGAHDLPDFRAIGERLAAEIPGAELAVLDTAHLPALERPVEFNRLVLDFLG